MLCKVLRPSCTLESLGKLLESINAQISSLEIQVHWVCTGARAPVSSSYMALHAVQGLGHGLLGDRRATLLSFSKGVLSE